MLLDEARVGTAAWAADDREVVVDMTGSEEGVPGLPPSACVELEAETARVAR